MEAVNKAIEGALLDCMNEIIAKHQAAGQVATGETMRSLSVVKVADMHFQMVQQGGAPLGTLDEGRPAGKVPRGFWQIIARWAEAKGITFADEKQANRFARAVAWKIHTDGTRRYHANEDVVRSCVENLEKDVLKTISAVVAIDFKRRIFRTDFND